MNLMMLLEGLMAPPIKVVKTTEKDDAVVTTYKVEGDNIRPYFSEVSHPDFDRGRPMVVNQYFTEKEAEKGHNDISKIFLFGKNKPEVVEIFVNQNIRMSADSKIVEAVCFRNDVVRH